MDAVIDTNVLVSGMLNPSGAPGEIVDWAISGQVVAAFDDRIMFEYSTVLRREKFRLDERDVGAVIAAIRTQGRRVLPVRCGCDLPDDKDRCFLECASVTDSRILVTGNIRHFPPHLRAGVNVVVPAEFVKMVR